MSDHVLTIQRILSDGAVAKTVTCRSGRIAVFRSHAPEKLYEYELALRGKLENPSSFRIMFDGKAYDPTQAIFIGFENIRYRAETTARTLLSESGVPANELDTILQEHGLYSIGEKALTDLSTQEAHALALLQISLQSFPLLIMKDPFLSIPDKFREMYAHTLANGIWKNKGIAIVASLSWRPDAWIDNDIITRVQIDQTARRATVGIGGENPLTELAQQLRQEKHVTQAKKSAEEALEKAAEKVGARRRAPRFFSSTLFRLSAISVLFISVGLGILINRESFSSRSSQSSSLPVETSLPISSSENTTQSNQLVLDSYPVDIRDGIVAAFSGEASLSDEARFVPLAQQEQGAEANDKSSDSPNLNTMESTPPPRASQGSKTENPLISLRDLSELSNTSTSSSGASSSRTQPKSIVQNTNISSFENRMEKLMEGKDPATQERIRNLIDRMRERAAERGQ